MEVNTTKMTTEIEDDKSKVNILPDIEVSCIAKDHISLDIQSDNFDAPEKASIENATNRDETHCLDGGDDILTTDVWDTVHAGPELALVHVIQPQNAQNENNGMLQHVLNSPNVPNVQADLVTVNKDQNDDKCFVRILSKKNSAEPIVIDDSDDEAKVVIDEKQIIDVDAIKTDEPEIISSYIPTIKYKSAAENLLLGDQVVSNPNPYKCKYCNQQFLDDGALKVHIGTEHKDTLQICTICNKAFTTKAFLNLHQETKHNLLPKRPAVPLVCYICDDSFTSGKLFSEHMEKHCVQVVVPGYESEEKENEESNEDSVSNKENPPDHDLDCSLCERKEFRTKYCLRQHYIYSHSNYRPFLCEVCNMGFMNTARLKTHYIIKHNYGKMTMGSSKLHVKQEIKQEKDVVIFKSASNSQHNICVKCKKDFDHRILYLIHMEMEHGVKIKPNEEMVSNGKVMDRPSQRKVVQESFRPDNHMRLKFKWCVICGSKFPTNSQLLKHKQTAHKGQSSFPCSRCNKRFPTVIAVEQHIKLHCSGQTLCCSFCDKFFRTKVALQKHMRIHIGWEYKCSLCKREYSNSGSLKRHYISWHSDFMPFCCSFCGNKFNCKASCRQHIRQKHIDVNANNDLTKSFNDVVSSLIEPVVAERKIICKCGEEFDHSILQAYHAEEKHGIKITREHKAKTGCLSAKSKRTVPVHNTFVPVSEEEDLPQVIGGPVFPDQLIEETEPKQHEASYTQAVVSRPLVTSLKKTYTSVVKH